MIAVSRAVQAAFEAAENDGSGIDWPTYAEAFDPIVMAVLRSVEQDESRRCFADALPAALEHERICYAEWDRTNRLAARTRWEDAKAVVARVMEQLEH